MNKAVLFMFFLLLHFLAIGQDKCNCEVIDTIRTTNAFTHFEKSKNELCQIYYLLEVFNLNIKERNYAEAENQIKSAINLYKKSNCKEPINVTLLSRLDQAYTFQSKFDESLEINISLRDYYESKKDSTKLVKSILQIAKIYD
ncbi:MAG: hypothetical protein WAT92_04565, partial [Saprospiraceae bacterium]